jgi:hypothetical protein
MDRVTIINRALARIGCRAIQSELEPGPAGIEVVATLDSVLEDLLSKYPWHFTRRFAGLSRLDVEQTLGWRSAFMLPPDRLALPRAYFDSASSDRPVQRLQLAGDRVLADAWTLFAEYQVKPPVIDWPGHFRELVVLALSAEYALEVREDPQLRNALRRDAYGVPEMQGEGGQFKVSADLDAQAQTSPTPAGGRNPLTDAHDNGWSSTDARYGW